MVKKSKNYHFRQVQKWQLRPTEFDEDHFNALLKEDDYQTCRSLTETEQ